MSTKECVFCNGEHHYTCCPKDNTKEDGSIDISNHDILTLIELVNEKVKTNTDNKYKLLHKKLLDIACI